MQSKTEVNHYIRIGADHARYSNGVIPGAYLLKLCSDASGELSIRHDGKAAWLARLQEVDFLEPVYAGEAVMIRVRITRVGNRSRDVEMTVDKTLRMQYRDGAFEVEALEEPIPVLRGMSTMVLMKDK
jgi:3-aminobutyryl-CoA ammonia-lyase